MVTLWEKTIKNTGESGGWQFVGEFAHKKSETNLTK